MSSPLAPVTSIKVKLGLLVSASVLTAALVGVLAADSGVPVLLAVPVTVALALAVTQLLAVGMTSPLREMTEATRRMAAGDYGGRVHAESSDEVGELARAFNQMASELATVDSEQRNLIATVSHELRTPVAALTAVLENLADGVVPADPAHLDAAVAQAQRVGALVSDLLELSRVEAGMATLRLSSVGLASVLDEVVADLTPTSRDVSFDLDVSASLSLQADRVRLRQLLTNVLDNAVRHSPEGGVVSVRGVVSGDRCVLDVTDAGPGVAPPDRERAFERFGTLTSDADAEATGGTGLGLAIARWVAGLHGGTVRFVEPPAGTTGAVLRIDLPIRPSTPLPSPSPPTSQQETTMETNPQPVPVATTPAPPRALDPVFGRYWPDLAAARLALVLAGVAVGVAAAVLLPENLPGLALFVVLAAAGGTVWWAAKHRREPFTMLCLGLAALSILPILLLDARWIGVLCILGGATAMVVGVSKGRRVLEFVLAGLSWPLACAVCPGSVAVCKELSDAAALPGSPSPSSGPPLRCWSSVCSSSLPTPSWPAGSTCCCPTCASTRSWRVPSSAWPQPERPCWRRTWPSTRRSSPTCCPPRVGRCPTGSSGWCRSCSSMASSWCSWPRS